MSDRAALISAIADSPDDDLPKLVFADWLDEHGEGARAEFIRLQIAARNEANQFPPVTDAKKLARIRELFLANYRDWLRPVFEAFLEPLPVFDRAPGEPRTWLGRGLRWVGEFFWVMSGRDLGGTPEEDDEAFDEDEFTVEPTGVWMGTYGRGEKSGVTGGQFECGFLGSIHLSAEGLHRRADWAVAMAAEPITQFDIDLAGEVGLWRRVEGPHLARVRSLIMDFTTAAGTDQTAVAREFFRSAHLPLLNSLTLQNADSPDDLLHELRSSPLCRRLTELSVDGVANAWSVFGPPDHGFDALRELSIGFSWRAEEWNRFWAARMAESLRTQLVSLWINTISPSGPEWIVGGSPWARLERLGLHGEVLGDAGATRLADTDTFPVLHVLQLSHNGITDEGAVALARSPWLPRLKAFNLRHNPITDVGAVELATLLDRGLGYLEFQCHSRGAGVEIVDDCISPQTQRRLKARYGPRIDFPQPV